VAFNFSPLQIIALVVAIVGAIIDVRTTKIPNLLTFPATLIGLIFNAIIGGWPGLANAGLGAFIGAVLTIVFSGGAKKKIGFGDAKMLMAMGAFLGWKDVLLVFFWFSIVWGLVALYRFLSVFPIKTMLGSFFAKNAGGSWFTAESAAKMQKSMQTPIALGPWLALGVLLAELLGESTLKFMGFQ